MESDIPNPLVAALRFHYHRRIQALQGQRDAEAYKLLVNVVKSNEVKEGCALKASDFTITGILGEGGFGKVYKVTDYLYHTSHSQHPLHNLAIVHESVTLNPHPLHYKYSTHPLHLYNVELKDMTKAYSN